MIHKITIGIKSSQQARCYSLCISFCSCNLPSKTYLGMRNLKCGIQAFWSIDKRISVHNSITEEFCFFKAWNHTKHTLLFSPKQVCLETHKIISRSLRVFTSQLAHGIRSCKCCARSINVQMGMVFWIRNSNGF